MNEAEAKTDFNKSLERLKRTTLSIGRIPEKSKTRFLEIAKDEFENDYGMLLKWLIDYRDGLLSNPNEELNAKINVLAEEIEQLKNQIKKLTKQPKEEELIMADGSKKRIGR